MKLIVNGEACEVPDGVTIQGLLDHLGIEVTQVAVEVNETVVRRARHEQHPLAPSDRVEIVTFVGGG